MKDSIFRINVLIGLSFIIYHLSLIPAGAQDLAARFRTVDVKDGLADNFVRDITTDSEGYVWFSTINGVSRYDGYRFLNFMPREWGGDSGDVAMVRETADSTLWMVCQGELLTYRRVERMWAVDGLQRLQQLGVKGQEVRRFYVDEGGSLWVATEQGLFHYDYTRRRLSRYDVGGASVLHVVTKGNVTLVVTADYNIYKVEQRLSLLTKVPGMTSSRGSRALLDSRMNLWIYQSHALAGTQLIYSLSDGLWRQADWLRQMGNTSVNVIAEDRDGNLWIGSGNKGVWVWPLDAPPSSLNVQRSTLTPHITCFYHDRNNTMWVGSAKLGAAFTDLNSPRFTHVSTGRHEDVSALLEDREGRLYIGFDGDGVTCGDRHWSVEQGQLPSDIVTSLAMDPNGNILVGTYGNGIAVLGAPIGSAASLCEEPSPLNYVKAMAFDKHGSLWVATVDAGVVRKTADGQLTHFRSANAPLPSDGILCLCYDEKRDWLYIGTSNSIAVYDCGHGRFLPLYGDSQAASIGRQLTGTYVTSLLTDDNGWLWIGSRNGLWLCDPDSGNLTHITTEQGLSHNVVRAIAKAANGIWVSTDNGLTFLPSTLHPQPFYDADGLYDVVFSNNAALTTRDGTVLLGCYTGYVSILDAPPSPLKVQSSTLHPLRVKLTELRINGDMEVRPTEPLTIRHDERLGLSVSVMVPALSHKTRYLYRFKGEDEWMRAPGNMLYFASLMPGSHVLQVKAEVPGLVTTEALELNIRVLPPFWQSTPAFVLYLLLLLLAVALIWFVVRQWKQRELAIMQLKDKVLEWSQKVQARVGRQMEISPSEITVSSLDEELVSNVIRHIEEHMADADYSVAQLGSDVGMTRGHLYKKLMAIVGKSPVEFIRIIKMKRGKSLLEQGKTNISEVADMVGYSPKQFARYFKMMYGVTPSEYLKTQRLNI